MDAHQAPAPPLARVAITYCTQCQWLLRAAWMAQELLSTFTTELGEVALRPGTGGVFDVHVDDDLVWSRAARGRFPDIKELKQLVRDRVAPGKALGHTDRHALKS
ncbi:MAG: SelT/SelW/SelH family protein [Gammaproteobacteria bacterium]